MSAERLEKAINAADGCLIHDAAQEDVRLFENGAGVSLFTFFSLSFLLIRH